MAGSGATSQSPIIQKIGVFLGSTSPGISNKTHMWYFESELLPQILRSSLAFRYADNFRFRPNPFYIFDSFFLRLNKFSPLMNLGMNGQGSVFTTRGYPDI